MNINRTLMTLIFMISSDLICDYQLNPCRQAGVSSAFHYWFLEVLLRFKELDNL